MQIQIQSIHFDANEKLLSDTTEKLSKLEKLYDRIEKCSVILKEEKNREKKKFMVEVRLAVPKEGRIRGFTSRLKAMTLRAWNN